MSTDIGNQYDVVTISIDPTESHVLAKTKKEMYVGMYGRPGAAQGWHFLTGDEPQIKQLADAVGFRYAYDPDTKQFAHASAIMLLTPEGKISRYFYGIQYPPAICAWDWWKRPKEKSVRLWIKCCCFATTTILRRENMAC